MNGSKYERDFARLLDDLGYAVMRSPASGSATERDQPDLFFGRDGTRHAVELKSTEENAAYFEPEEIDALERFAKRMDAFYLLGARFKGDTTFYLFDPKDARRTPTEKYAVDRDMTPFEVFEP